MAELARLYPVRREHLDALSDEVGILQHAIGRRPDPGHGYCTDDVARALVVDIAQQREVGWQPIEASAWRSLRFLIEAFNPATRRFRNLRRIDGQWLDSVGSEDANARALVALADSIAGAPSATFAEAADSLFRQALPMASSLAGLRPRAAVLLACEAATRAGSAAKRRRRTGAWRTTCGGRSTAAARAPSGRIRTPHSRTRTACRRTRSSSRARASGIRRWCARGSASSTG